LKPSRWVCLFAVLACGAAIARTAAPPRWPDTPLARTQALALLQTLNAALLSHDSATLTLEHWCGAHHMASPARVIALRVRGDDKLLPPDWRAQLAIGAAEPVRYRRVQLKCGDHVLSEADNWYLPNRLTAAMNRQLDSSDVPFGKVVQPLHFRRKTLSADLLWSPLPAGWELHRAQMRPTAGPLAMPHFLLQHRALLLAGDGRPFSALVETYTDQVLAF
jgi:chorismate-pyruvate lyase